MPNATPSQEDEERTAHDQAEDVAGAGAESPPNAEFPIAIRDRVGGDAVDANHADTQRDRGKDAEQRGEEALALELRAEVRVNGAHLRDRHRRIDARDRRAHRRRERHRIADRAKHERHAHPLGLERCALAHELLPVERVDERLHFGLAAVLPRVGDDADDLARPLAVIVVEPERQAFADGLLARPVGGARTLRSPRRPTESSPDRRQ